MAIRTLEIKNFKSIKDLNLNCKKINVFIGEPNTGKSNILEAIGLLSHACYGKLANFVRFETMVDLFYNRNIGDPIRVVFDGNTLQVAFERGSFKGIFLRRQTSNVAPLDIFDYGYDGSQGITVSVSGIEGLDAFKFFRFNRRPNFPETESDFLKPPDGANLLQIILTNKDLKRVVSDLFRKFGYRVVLNPAESKIEIQKDLEDIVISIPYALSSETLQRITFYLAAIYSNKDSVLGFEEPEAHAFPYYTKYLGERIALDTANNQFFIATHNPYFLMSILEKAPKSEIATFVTYFEDYQTKVKALSGDEIERALAMGSDVFFNIDQFLVKDSTKGN